MMATELSNQLIWSKTAGIREWQFRSRLDPFTHRIRSIKPDQTEAAAHLTALQQACGPRSAKRGAYA